jgi:hypothetical protein
MFSDFFKDKLDSEHIKIEAFRSILDLILKNNFFKYNNKFFKQILGIAMGSICGPSIANLFVFLYEKKWLFIHKPLIYFRFIDDILIILKNLEELESLKLAFGSLTLNIVIGKSVNFLDLKISINSLTSYIDFSMYFKPTNTFSYLQTTSNHPAHIFKNLIKSLLIRARRICSNFNDFIYFGSCISKQLMDRGYDRILIDKNFRMVSKLDRNELLLYKNKKSIDFNKNFILRNTFDNNILNFNKIAHKAFSSFKENNEKFKDFKLMIVNRMQNNLSSLLVHNFKYPYEKNCSYKNCGNLNCKTCLFSNPNKNIFLTKNFILPIINNSNCNSLDIIYLIHCKFCNSFYIGQAKKLQSRMYNHIYDIKTFLAFKKTTSVSTHFNLKHHNFQKDFSFFVFRIDIVDLDARLNVESFLLNLCKKLKVNLMNEHIPILKDFYKF